MPYSYSHVRRGKRRIADADLYTTRLVGAGWTWECDCGEKGAWHGKREEATAQARVHKFFAHGERDKSATEEKAT